MDTLYDAARRRAQAEAPKQAAQQDGDNARRVEQLRQVLLWPLELMRPRSEQSGATPSYRALSAGALGPHWSELADEFPDDANLFQERHYREFVSFHPYVQRFLYGTRAADAGRAGDFDAPVRIFRRRDIVKVRVTLDKGQAALVLDVAHVDLYAFHDVDLVILAIEIAGRDLNLELVQDLIYRLGRTYPSGWQENGQAAHCADRVEWLDGAGQPLAVSDYEAREKFTASVCRNRVPATAAHWEFLLAPLKVTHTPGATALAFRPVEYYRLPQMAFLAVADPTALTENDFVRLGLALAPGDPGAAPFAQQFLEDFRRRYCYDRYHDPLRRDGDWIDSRVVCCGHTFVLVGDARRSLVTDPERGVLAQFRHQYFLLGLIAHFHRASLLMMSDQLVRIISRLDIDRPETVSRFRYDVRKTHEVFLRFTHRYWFCEVTDQAVGRDLFRLWSGHLETERLHAGAREELQDMTAYLDSDLLRRTSRTMVRLTVVAILSLIGTATTGFFGMNLLDAASWPFFDKAVFFSAIGALVTGLTIYTVLKARRLADFLDTLADERLPWRYKLRSFFAIWGRR